MWNHGLVETILALLTAIMLTVLLREQITQFLVFVLDIGKIFLAG